MVAIQSFLIVCLSSFLFSYMFTTSLSFLLFFWLSTHTVFPDLSCLSHCQSVGREQARHRAILRGLHRAVTASRACWQLGAHYPKLMVETNYIPAVEGFGMRLQVWLCRYWGWSSKLWCQTEYCKIKKIKIQRSSILRMYNMSGILTKLL